MIRIYGKVWNETKTKTKNALFSRSPWDVIHFLTHDKKHCIWQIETMNYSKLISLKACFYMGQYNVKSKTEFKIWLNLQHFFSQHILQFPRDFSLSLCLVVIGGSESVEKSIPQQSWLRVTS